jgi:hypothetical protein
MKNPISAMFDDAKELFVVGIMVIVFLIILGILATMPGITPEAKAVAEQGQQTISWIWIFYLGLPSVGVIIAIIIWVKKRTENPNFLV